MWPTLVSFPVGSAQVPMHTWGLMITLAFLAAATVVQLRAHRAGVDGDRLVPLYLVAFVAGLLGARLLHFTMAEPKHFFSDPLVFLRLWEGGFAFYGGMIMGILGGIGYAFARRIPVWRLTDVGAPAIMLGLAIGRIGCFCAGCCHGHQVDLPPDAVDILPAAFTGGAIYLSAHPPFLFSLTHLGVGLNEVPVLPTQLWAVVLDTCLFLVLSWRWRNRRFDGQVLAWLLLLYPIVRTTLEMFRGDTVRGVGWFGLLSTSQLVSIPIFVTGLVILLLRRGRGLAHTEQRDVEQDLVREMMED